MSLSSPDSPSPDSGRSPEDLVPWLGIDPGRAGPWLARLTWAFVGLGVVLRVSRYLANFPLWGDEAFVAVNFIDRGYLALLRPLEYGQICPLLFLWIERWAVVHFGFHEWSLRLFPLACGVSSVFLFRHVAGRVLGGVPLLLAVAIFAVSSHPIRHSAEVKPYATDLLVALLLLAPALEWRRAPGRTDWLWALAALMPPALALSHPAVFAAGGVSLGLLGPVRRSGSRAAWVPFLLIQATLVGSFLGLYALFTELQGRAALNGLRAYWAASFPPLDHPGRLLRWLAEVHTGSMFAYPAGGKHGSSVATTLAVVTASALLWRRGRRDLVAMLLVPFGLALAAAALRRYPYGGEARQMQFVAPAICLLGGLGAAWALRALCRPWPRLRPAAIPLAVLLLGVAGAFSLAGDRARPYRFLYDRQAREFARGFWPALGRGAEVACLRQDFGIVNLRSMNLRTAVYRCNQMIYSPSRRAGTGPRWDAVSPARPLRCVLYHETPPDYPAVVAWLAGMRTMYDLHRTETVEMNADGSSEGPKRERIVIYEFLPKGVASVAASTAPDPGTRVQ